MARKSGFKSVRVRQIVRSVLGLLAALVMQACGFLSDGTDTSRVTIQIPDLAERADTGFLPASAEDFAARRIVALRLVISGAGMDPIVRSVDSDARTLELDVPSGTARVFTLMAFGALDSTPAAIDLWRGSTTVDLLSETAEVAVRLSPEPVASRLTNLELADGAGSPPRLVLSLVDGTVVRPFEEFSATADVTEAEAFNLVEVAVPAPADSQLWGAGQLIALSRDGLRHAVIALGSGAVSGSAELRAGLPEGLAPFGGGVDLTVTRDGAASTVGGSLVLVRDGISVPAPIRGGAAQLRWLDEGSWTWTVAVAGDGALSGTVSVVAGRNVALTVNLPSRVVEDTVDPETQIDTFPPSVDNSLSSEFTFSANEFAVFECSFDNSDFVACDSPVLYTAGRAGSQIFRVRAIDAAGNRDETPASYSWTIDTIAPSPSFTAVPASPNNVTVHAIGFTSNDPGAVFECSLDLALFAPCTSPKTVNASVNGSHFFVVRAIDVAGNVSSEISTSWTLDTVIPDVAITVAPPALSNNASPVVQFTSTDGVLFYCSVNGGTSSACSSPHTVAGSPLVDGSYLFEVKSQDSAGNFSALTATTFAIDTTVPGSVGVSLAPMAADSYINFAEASANTSLVGTPSASESASFAYAAAPAAADCALIGSYGADVLSGVLANGTGKLCVQATDAAGNIGYGESVVVTVDTVSPTVTISGFPANPTNDTTPTFTFSSADGGVSFTCYVDSVSQGPCSSPYTPTISGDGAHTVDISATDAAGNTGGVSTHGYTLDTVLPNTSINSQPADPSNDATADFTFSADEPVSGFECNLDAGGFMPCTSPLATASLLDGAHSIEIRAVDLAGNVGAFNFANWTLDTVAPTAVLDSYPADPTYETSPVFSFSSPDGAVSFECFVDSVSQGGCSSPFMPVIVGDGSHTVDVVPTDAAGNVGSAASYTYVLDTLAPSLLSIDPINAASDSYLNAAEIAGSVLDVVGNLNASESATFEYAVALTTDVCSVVGGYLAPIPVPADFVSDGSYKVCVRLTDGAGLVGYGESTPIVRDTVAPALTDVQVSAGLAYTPVQGVQVYVTASGDYTWLKLASDAGMSSLYLDAAFASPSAIALAAGAGNKNVYAQVSDPAGNFSLALSDTIILDQAAPLGYVSAPAAISTTTLVATLGALDDFASAGELEMRLSGDIVGGMVWEPYAAAAAITLSVGDGAKAIYAEFRDPAGNTSAAASTSVVLDSVGPGVSSLDLDVTLSDGYMNLAEFSAGTGLPVISTLTFDEGVLLVEQSLESAGTNCNLAVGWVSDVFFDDHFTDADYKVCIRAFDILGNVNIYQTSTYQVDTVTPMLTGINLDGAAADSYINQTEQSDSFALVSGLTASEPALYEYVMETGANSCALASGYSASAPAAFDVVSDGSYKVCVRLTDLAGNIDFGQSSVFERDTLAPSANMDAYPPANTNATTVSFTFSSPDGGISFECFIDSFSQGACSSPYTPTIVGEGSHTVDVVPTDAAGNQGGPTGATYTLDTLPPTVGFDAYPANPTNDTTPSFDFSSPDGGLTFECKVDSVSQGACSSPFATTIGGDGWHLVEVIATDAASNMSLAAAYSYQLDTTAPQTTIDSGAPATSNTSGATFFFSADEPVSGFECQMDGGGFNLCSSPQPYGGLSDGSHTFEVRAIDLAGNVDATPASQTWTIDTVAPTVSIDSYPSNPTNDTTPSFYFSSSDGAVTFECFLNAVSQGPCTSPFVPFVSADGAHSIGVVGTDAAGNSSSEATHIFNTDTAIPSLISVSLANQATDGYINISEQSSSFALVSGITESETLSDLAFAVVSLATACSAAGYSVDVPTAVDDMVSDDVYKVCLKLTDTASNVGYGSSAPITRDTAAPTISLMQIESGVAVTNASPLLVTVFSPDGGSYLDVADDAGFSLMLYAGPITAQSVPAGGDGLRTVYARVQDAAGNYSADVSDSVIVDTSGPSGSVTIPGPFVQFANQNLALSASDTNFAPGSLQYVVTGDVVVGGSWLSYMPTPTIVLNAGDGLRTVNVQFRDPLGNLSSIYTTSTTIDNTDPLIAITAPADGLAVNLPPLLAGNLSDAAGSGVAQVWVSVFDGTFYWDGGDFVLLSPAYVPASLDSATDWSYGGLSSGNLIDGAYFVDVTAVDLVGNVSAVDSITFNFDASVPSCIQCLDIVGSGNGSLLNSTAITINSSSVTDAHGPVQMRVTGDVVDALANQWIAYSASSGWNLTAVDGSKSVYIEYRDALGNATTPFAALVTLDATPAAVTVLNFVSALGDASLNLAESAAYATAPITSSVSFSEMVTLVEQAVVADGTLCTAVGTWYPGRMISDLSADGAFRLCHRMMDLAGNVSYDLSTMLVVDRTPPVFTSLDLVMLAADGYLNANDALSSNYAVGNLAGSGYSSDAYQWAPAAADCSAESSYIADYPRSNELVTDGDYKGCARLADAAGNVTFGQSPAVTRDTTIPTISLIELAAGASVTNVDPIPVQVTSPDGGFYMQLASDLGFSGLLFDGVTGTENVVRGADGTQYVYARVRDLAGNYSLPATGFTVIDTQGPTGSIDIVPTSTNNSSQLLSINASDPNFGAGQIQMRISGDVLGGGSWEPYSTSVLYDLSGLDGGKTVYVEFRDALGNTSGFYSDFVQLDTDAPGLAGWGLAAELASGYLNSADQLSSSPVINWISPDEPTANVEYAVPSIGTACFMASYQSTVPVLSSLSSDDDYHACVHLVDPAGNEDWLELDVFTRDTSAPTLSAVVVNAGSAATNSTNLSVQLALTSADSLVIAQDVGMGSIIYSGVATASTNVFVSGGDGVKTVYARASDLAQNFSTIVSDDIVLDTFAPALTSLSLSAELQDGVYTHINNISNPSGSAVTDAGFDGPVALVEFTPAWFGDACFMQSGWTGALSNSAFVAYQGSAKLCVRIVDLASNVGFGESGLIEVDTVQPSLSSVSINAGAAYATSSIVNVSTVSSGATTMRIATDAGMTNLLYDGPYNDPQTVNVGFGESDVTLYVRLRDVVGNTNGVSLSDSIYRDTVPAAVAISAPANGVFATGIPDPVYGTASDAGSGVSSVTLAYENLGWWWNGASYGNGSPVEFPATGLSSWSRSGWVATSDGSQYQIRARVLDLAGNETLYSHTVTVDQSGPSVAISAPTFAAQISMPPVITGTSSDAWTSTQDVTVSVFSGSFYWDGAGFTSLSPMAFAATGTDSWSYAALATQALSNGTYVVDVVATDILGNKGFASTNFTLDQSGPSCTTCVQLTYSMVWGQYPYTSTYAVDLTSSGVSDPIGPLDMRVTGDVLGGGVWQAYNPTLPITLNWGVDGTKDVYVEYRDGLGNISGPFAASVTLDRAAPNVDQFVLSSYASEISDPNTVMQVSASGAPFTMDITGAISGPFTGVPYSGASTNVTLLGGEGIKVVWARVRDQANNQSLPVSDSVELDLTPPSVFAFVLEGGRMSVGSVYDVTATLDYDPDALEIEFGDWGVTAPVGWFAASAATSLTLSGTLGQVEYPGLTYPSSARASHRTKNGHTYIAGIQGTRTVYVARLDAHGELDMPFGNAGTAYVVAPTTATVDVSDVVVDEMNNIAVVGTIAEAGFPERIFVMRVQPNGALDMNFGGFGVVFLDLGGSDTHGTRIATYGDSYLIGGSVETPDHDPVLVLISQFNGVLQNWFGNAGNGWDLPVTGVAGDQGILDFATADGMGGTDIYFTYANAGDLYVSRYVGGWPDNGFDGDGTVQLVGAAPTGPVRVEVARDGSSFVMYSDGAGVAVHKYDPSGSADVGFGAGGEVYLPVGTGVKAWALHNPEGLSEDKLYVAATSNGATDLYMAALDIGTGALDAQFGSAGTVVTQWMGGGALDSLDLSSDPNGRLFVSATRAGHAVTIGLDSRGRRNGGYGMGGNGNRSVFARARDVFGRTSSPVYDNIDVDTLGPNGMVTAATMWVSSLSQVVFVQANDSSPITAMVLSGDISNGDIFQPFNGSPITANVELNPGQGRKYVGAMVVDEAQNIGTGGYVEFGFDLSAPTGSISGPAFVSNVNYTFTSTASDQVAYVDELQMRYEIDVPISGAMWIPFNPVQNITLPAGEGVKTVRVQFRDPAGHVSPEYNLQVTLDSTLPQVTVLSPEFSGYVSNYTGLVTGVAFDPGVAPAGVTYVSMSAYHINSGMFFDGFGFANGIPMEFPVSVTQYWSWADLTSVAVIDGHNYEIQYTVVDAAGNVNTGFSGYSVDQQPPTCGLCFEIHTGIGSDEFTANGEVTAYANSVFDPRLTYVMYSGDITDGFKDMWMPYTPDMSLHVGGGDGVKNIYARYADGLSNMTGWFADQVTLDTTAPAPFTVSVASGAPAINYTTSVQVDITSPEGVRFDIFGDVDTPLNGVGFIPVSGSQFPNLQPGDGTKTVFIRMYDAAGNSRVVSDTVDVDTVGPTGSISGPGVVFSQFSIPITLAAGDAHGVTHMRFSGSDVAFPTTGAWIAYGTNQMVDVFSGDGTKTISIEYRDSLGNIGSTFSHNVFLDTTPPSAPGAVSATIKNAGTGEMYVTWQQVAGATGYEVHYDLNSGDPYTGSQAIQGSSPRFVAGGAVTNITLTGFLPGQEIFVAVKAVEGPQTGPYSAEAVTGIAGTMVLYPEFMAAATGPVQLKATKSGNASYDLLAHSGAIVGDIDFDGREDYAWGVPDGDHTFTNAGEVRIYSGFNNSPLLVTSANDPASSNFGESIARWGVDLNADGRMDYLVADPGYNSGDGRVYAMSGFPGAVPLWTASGLTGDQLGMQLISTDDVNGDGIRDVVASRNGGIVQLSGADGAQIRDIPGIAASALAEVPDINGDGIDDFIVGDNIANNEVYALRSTDGVTVRTISNPVPGFGQALAVGDFDGDTEIDVAVGAPSYEFTGSDRGVVFVYRLATGVLLQQAQGDVDGDMLGGRLAMADTDHDGMAEIFATAGGVDGAGTDRGALYVLRGGNLNKRIQRLLPDTTNSAGFGSSLFVGDVDHNGNLDVFVGASTDPQPSQLGSGRRYEMPAQPKVYASGDVQVAYSVINMGGRKPDQVEVRLDGGQWQKYSATGFYDFSFPVTSLVHGLRNVEARIVDDAGYAGPVTTLSFEVDLSVPQMVNLTSPNDGQAKEYNLTNVGFNDERIAVDAGGKMHIAYREGSNLKYSTNLSGSWVTETVASSIYALDDLEVDSLGKAHIVYRVTVPGNELRYINRVSGSWGGFQTVRNVAVQVPAMVMDNAGKAHLAWADGSTVQYSSNVTGPWSAPTQIYGQSITDLDMARRRNNGKLYVAVKNASGQAVVIDNEAGWASVIAESTNVGMGMAVTVDTAGKTHLVYRHSTFGTVRYNTNVSGSYNAIDLDNSVTNGNWQDISLDSTGKPIVTYACSSGCDGFVFMQRFNGAVWRKTKLGGGNPNRAQHALAMDDTVHSLVDNGIPGLRLTSYRFLVNPPMFGGSVTDPVISGIGNVIRGVEWTLAKKGAPDKYWDGAQFASDVTQVHFNPSTGNFNFPMPTTGGDNAGAYELRIVGVDGGFNRSGAVQSRMFEYLP